MRRLAIVIVAPLLFVPLAACSAAPNHDKEAQAITEIPGVVDADSYWDHPGALQSNNHGVVAVGLGSHPDPSEVVDLVDDVFEVAGEGGWCKTVVFVLEDSPDAESYAEWTDEARRHTGAEVDPEVSSMKTECDPMGSNARSTAARLRTVVEVSAAVGSPIHAEVQHYRFLDISIAEAGLGAAWPDTLHKIASVQQPAEATWTVTGTDFSMESEGITARTAQRWEELVSGIHDLPGIRVSHRHGDDHSFHVDYEAGNGAQAATKILTKQIHPAARRLAAQPEVEFLTMSVTSDDLSTETYKASWGLPGEEPGRWRQR